MPLPSLTMSAHSLHQYWEWRVAAAASWVSPATGCTGSRLQPASAINVRKYGIDRMVVRVMLGPPFAYAMPLNALSSNRRAPTFREREAWASVAQPAVFAGAPGADGGVAACAHMRAHAR